MTAFRCALVFAAALTASPAAAEDADSQAFAGGQVTISETADGDRILAFDGQELARDWFVGFDRAATVAGTDILLYSVGPGGNACGPDAVIVWKPDDGAVRADRFGDCGAPPAANDGERLVFLPWVAPGEAAAVTIWTPADGFRLAGRLAFAPQPGTGWADLAKAPAGHPLDYFANADFYDEAQRLLGDDLGDLATSLGTAGPPEDKGDGLFVARGCVPHACGTADGFVAVDTARKSAWFAQMGENGAFRFWPAESTWPAPVSAAFTSAFVE